MRSPTTSSFNQTVRYLKDKVNILSLRLALCWPVEEHNQGSDILTKDDEVEILLH